MCFFVIIVVVVIFMYSNELVCDILNYVDNNINKKITIDDIAFKFNYNRYHIMKLFKREIGCGIVIYINNIRIYNCIRDIRENDYSFTKIALRNGFYSLEYFSEIFHKVIGVSPRVYKNFCGNRYKVSYDELEILMDNWVNLEDFVNKINKYKKNKKPTKIPVLKRSIFY